MYFNRWSGRADEIHDLYFGTATTISPGRLPKGIFCAGKRGICVGGSRERRHADESFPLKYPLGAGELPWKSRCERQIPRCYCRCRCYCCCCCCCLARSLARLLAAVVREMRNCDGPPSWPFDQTYHPDRIYVSRHSTYPHLSPPPFPLVAAAASCRRPSLPHHSVFLPCPRKTSSDTETAISWDFTSRRCDTALSSLAKPPSSFPLFPPWLHRVALRRATFASHRRASDFQDYIARVRPYKMYVGGLAPATRFAYSKASPRTLRTFWQRSFVRNFLSVL